MDCPKCNGEGLIAFVLEKVYFDPDTNTTIKESEAWKDVMTGVADGYECLDCGAKFDEELKEIIDNGDTN